MLHVCSRVQVESTRMLGSASCENSTSSLCGGCGHDAGISEVNCRFLRRDYLHRDGFFVFGPMELKIGGVTLLRVLNQWFTKVFVIFDISVYSGSIMILDVPFSTTSMDLKGFDNNLKNIDKNGNCKSWNTK